MNGSASTAGCGSKKLTRTRDFCGPTLNWTGCNVNNPLQTTLHDAVLFLNGERIPYALIGGLATSLRGIPRVTVDVDLVIAAELTRSLELLGIIEQSPFRPLLANPAEIIEKSFLLPLRHRVTNVKVDVAIGLSGFERQAIARAESIELAGVDVQVASAEDLLLMKVLAGRPQDEQDIDGLIVAQGERLDWEYCLSLAEQLGEAIGQDLALRIKRLRKSQEDIE